MSVQQFLIGISGAVVGVIGWLFVGMLLQRRDHARRARDAGRAVYFELGANHLVIFTAAEYGVFGSLSRANFDRLLPELATWLPAAELQALVLAYLGHGGYEQAARDEELPVQARHLALSSLLEAHGLAVRLLRSRVFTAKEIASLDKYAGTFHAQLIEAAADSDRA